MLVDTRHLSVKALWKNLVGAEMRGALIYAFPLSLISPPQPHAAHSCESATTTASLSSFQQWFPFGFFPP